MGLTKPSPTEHRRTTMADASLATLVLVAATLLVAVAGLAYLLAVAPVLAGNEQMREEISSLGRTSVDDRLSAQEATIEAQWKTTSSAIATLAPLGRGDVAVFEALTHMLDEAQLHALSSRIEGGIDLYGQKEAPDPEVTLRRLLESDDSQKTIHWLPLGMLLTGSYRGLTRLCMAIADYERLIVVDSLAVRLRGGDLEIDLRASAAYR